jgi:hypothetical protein
VILYFREIKVKYTNMKSRANEDANRKLLVPLANAADSSQRINITKNTLNHFLLNGANNSVTKGAIALPRKKG